MPRPVWRCPDPRRQEGRPRRSQEQSRPSLRPPLRARLLRPGPQRPPEQRSARTTEAAVATVLAVASFALIATIPADVTASCAAVVVSAADRATVSASCDALAGISSLDGRQTSPAAQPHRGRRDAGRGGRRVFPAMSRGRTVASIALAWPVVMSRFACPGRSSANSAWSRSTVWTRRRVNASRRSVSIRSASRSPSTCNTRRVLARTATLAMECASRASVLRLCPVSKTAPWQ